MIATHALEDLLASLDTEARLLTDLRDTLARQRAGVAADDVAQVDAATHAVSRALLTLEEAGRRRLELIDALTGGGEGRLSEVEELFGPDARLSDVRSRLRTTAELVVRDLTINQTVLRRALRSGEAYLQMLLAPAAGPKAGYTAGPVPVEESARGVLLNRSA